MKIVKVPYGKGGLGKTEGTEKGPEKILEELEKIYINENEKEISYETSTIEIKETLSKTHKIIQDYKGSGIFIGGDHSLTYSAFRGFKHENTGLIVFDAHPDLMEGTDIPTHEDYLRKLIQEGHVNPENVILVGLRNIHPHEKEYMQQNKINYFTCKSIYKNGIHNIADNVMAKAKSWSQIYISIDIDVLDPSVAPGTVHSEPGGISLRELLYFLQRLRFLKKIYSADVVEVCPQIDVNNITSRAAAKIIGELL
ncbi:MAG: arginase family protein [Nanoarchaeota archaeon]